MAAIADPEGALDLDQLTDGINKNLPTYARPLFVRVSKEIETTSIFNHAIQTLCCRRCFSMLNSDYFYVGTHKMKKIDLQREGFCKKTIEDPIFFYLDSKYVELTTDLYDLIMKGEVRL